MLSISNEYELSLSDNSNQLIKGAIRFADKTTRELTGDDIVSCSFDQQVSSEGSFDVGTAIIGQMNITLNNHDGRFDACDFTDSKFKVWVGKELSTGTEWIQRGLYTANQPDAYNGTIAISALDTISRFEVPFSEFVEATGLPLNNDVQIRRVIDIMCQYRGVMWDDDGNRALDRPFVFAYVDQSATCRQVLAYCCQVCCVNASATYNGHLRTAWYDTSVFESEDDCDGGVFDSDSPYSTGASKDGGDFIDYSSGDSIDGGTFITNRSVHQLYAFSNVTVNTDDVVITGVRVSERNVTENNETINGETVQVGEDGYVLSISNNPLILPGSGRDVAETIANKVIGMRFRPFSGKHICIPSIEAGDCAYVIDRKQNMHRSYVTRVKYTVNGGMTVSCGAKSASRNSADNAGASTSAYVKARNEIQRELSARDLAIKSLGESLANAKGMYHTEVKQEDGSIVYYLHDKPTTDQSKIIYKIAADGIGISTDSGKTYATGLTADGDAILKRIYAIGINADYVSTGRLTAQNGYNYIDLDTGEAVLKLGTASTVDGSSILSNFNARYVANQASLDRIAQIVDAQRSSDATRMGSLVNRAGSFLGVIAQQYGLVYTDEGCTYEALFASMDDVAAAKNDADLDAKLNAFSAAYDNHVKAVETLNSALLHGESLATKLETTDYLDQKKIFNKLTNNGQDQGIYLQDGKVYLNGEYIKAGTVTADRLTTGNGSLVLSSTSTGGSLKYGSFSSAIIFGKNSIGFNLDNSLYTGMFYVEPDSFMFNSISNSASGAPLQVAISHNSALISTGGGRLEIKNNHLYFNDRQIA